MRRGRPALGPRHVEKLDGSPGAKKRLKVILETLAGEKTIPEACSDLGIGGARFHELRDRVLEAAVRELGERPRGRPPKRVSVEQERIDELEEEIAKIKRELQGTQVREEISLLMPHLLEPREAKKKSVAIQRHTGRHEAMVKKIVAMGAPMADLAARRELEREVRVMVVATCRWMVRGGLSRGEVAIAVGIELRTLSRWNSKWGKGRLAAKPRGRPRIRSNEQTRGAIGAALGELGPGTGITVLRGLVSGVTRREIVELRHEFRVQWLEKNEIWASELRWTRAGAVWAADFTVAWAKIDGVYPYVLTGRDLGSYKQLLALPAEREDAGAVAGALAASFLEHGAPLVFKSDNGGGFISEQTRDVLDRSGVVALLSPPYTAPYNGGIEAGNGSLKVRTHYEAIRNGRPGVWTSDDVEQARETANRTARPWGESHPTPQMAWETRTPITREERATFQGRVEHERHTRLLEQQLPREGELDRRTQAMVARQAITRALVALGYLIIERRRITLPNNRLFRARIR